MNLVFDIETDDRDASKIHCIVALDPDLSLSTFMWEDDPSLFLRFCQDVLGKADRLIGHNICGFDLPVLKRLLGWEPRWNVELFDTSYVSQMIYAKELIYAYSIKMQRMAGRSYEQREARIPSKLLWNHSLESWGYRLREHKDMGFRAEEGAFDTYTPELLNYCKQDVRVNGKLYHYLRLKAQPKPKWPHCSEESMLVESKFARILQRQEENGVGFDIKAAEKLQHKLITRRDELTVKLRETFKPWVAPKTGQKGIGLPTQEGDAGYFVPKKSRVVTKGRPWPEIYTEGAAYTKVHLVEFKPGSHTHVGERLQRVFGWQPKEWNERGAVTDEKVLSKLDYPCIPDLLDYMVVAKTLGQLAEGPQSWMNHYRRETGTIHGRVKPMGTRTGRCSHSEPNLGQVPSKKKPYGEECRSLFHPVVDGWTMVGADAAGLELRMLAHRMAKYDGGAFAELLLEGDIHEDWRKKTGLFTRDGQKTFTYAMLYGAGDEKLGEVVLEDWRIAERMGLTDKKAPPLKQATIFGRRARNKLLTQLPALRLLLNAVKRAHKRGYIRGLDGRVIVCKTEHGALNDLLQGDGACVMKHACVRFDDEMQRLGKTDHYHYMLNVHDEAQFEVKPGFEEEVGTMFVDAIKWAGDHLNLRVALDGEWKAGKTWKDTH